MYLCWCLRWFLRRYLHVHHNVYVHDRPNLYKYCMGECIHMCKYVLCTYVFQYKSTYMLKGRFKSHSKQQTRTIEMTLKAAVYLFQGSVQWQNHLVKYDK